MIKKAAEFIKAGGVVAFPTETVYGLGADATNEEACREIFKIKGRPSINPLIVHVASMHQAESIAEFNEDAYRLCKQFWPGPLSIVLNLKKDHNIASIVLAGLSTIALRMPSHPVALELITRSGTSIAAPSANPSGYISATEIHHVREHFGLEKIYILESLPSLPPSHCEKSSDVAISGGITPAAQDCHASLAMTNRRPAIARSLATCQSQEALPQSHKIATASPRNDGVTYGLESTIIDITSSDPVLLRHGFITLESLELVINKKIKVSNSLMEIKAPGMLDRHYAPNTKLRINAEKLESTEIGLNFGNTKLNSNYNLNLSETGDLIEAAANLYSMLRQLDNYAILNKNIGIAIAPIPYVNIGFAINDKLKRASFID